MIPNRFKVIFDVTKKEIFENFKTLRLIIISIIFLIVFLIIAVYGGYIVGSANPDEAAYERGANNVLSMVLAFTGIFPPILAIALSYDSIVGERTRRSLHLVLSKPVDRSSIYIGKFLGSFLSIAIVYMIVVTIGYAAVIGMSGKVPSLEDVGRAYAAIGIILFSAACWVLFVMLFSTSFKTVTSTIIFSVIFWFFILNFLSLSGLIYFMVSTSTADEPITIDIMNEQVPLSSETLTLFVAHRINDPVSDVEITLILNVVNDTSRFIEPFAEERGISVYALKPGNYSWYAEREENEKRKTIASGDFRVSNKYMPIATIASLDKDDKNYNDLNLTTGSFLPDFPEEFEVEVTSLKTNKNIESETYDNQLIYRNLSEGDYRVTVIKNNTTYLNLSVHSYGDKQSRTQMFGVILDDGDIEYPDYVKFTNAINPDNSASVSQEVITGESSPVAILSVSEGLIALTITFIYLLILGLFVFSRIELL
jgi:ABC-type transport system involved in multi-copper enzyme maturation permease subunit